MSAARLSVVVRNPGASDARVNRDVRSFTGGERRGNVLLGAQPGDSGPFFNFPGPESHGPHQLKQHGHPQGGLSSHHDGSLFPMSLSFVFSLVILRVIGLKVSDVYFPRVRY